MKPAPDPRETVVNPATGEAYDVVVVPRAQRYPSVPGGWLMSMQAGLDRVATDDTLKDGDLRVFAALMARLDWENFLFVEVSELAAHIGRDRTGVSRSMSRLVKAGILHRGPRVGKSFTYRLDPSIGWKGTPKGRASLAAELDRKGWQVIDGGNADENASGGAVPGQDAFDL